MSLRKIVYKCLFFVFLFSSLLRLITMDLFQHLLVKLLLQHGSQQADFHTGAIQYHLKRMPAPSQNTTPMHCMTTTLQLLLERHSAVTGLLVRLTEKCLTLHLCLLKGSLFLKGTNLWYVLPLFTMSQWNIDVTNCQGAGKNLFVINEGLSYLGGVLYMLILVTVGLMHILCYIEVNTQGVLALSGLFNI